MEHAAGVDGTRNGGQRNLRGSIETVSYTHLRCICQCQQEAEEQRKAAEERQRRMERIKRRKAQGLQDRYLYDYTFANDNGQNPLMDKARAYVENWKEAYKNNTGLLLFGDVGTGKSFFAGCIANALLDRDVPVLMTNFPTDVYKRQARTLSPVPFSAAPFRFSRKNLNGGKADGSYHQL